MGKKSNKRHNKSMRRRIKLIMRYGVSAIRVHKSRSGRKGKSFSKQLGSRRNP